MTVSKFRTMIVFYIVAIVVGYLSPVLSQPMKARAQELAAMDGYDAIIETNISVFLTLLVLNILIPVGLYYFSSLARSLFVLYTAATIMLILLWGYRVSSPLVNTMSFVSALLQGALLTTSYLFPIGEKFKKN